MVNFLVVTEYSDILAMHRRKPESKRKSSFLYKDVDSPEKDG
jgi:hypothetical protein